MKYKTGDLSKILGVSANTIRRFTEKGYLNPDRNMDNRYRFLVMKMWKRWYISVSIGK